MGIIGWIILGLIAGAIAKAIKPGEQGGGWLVTMLLSVVGALIGGWMGGVVFNVGLENFWSLQTWIVAILGSLLVLVVWGLLHPQEEALISIPNAAAPVPALRPVQPATIT